MVVNIKLPTEDLWQKKFQNQKLTNSDNQS